MSELSDDEFNLEYLSEAADYIKTKVPFTPNILIICGSGLGSLADTLQNPIILTYQEIPHFPHSTVKGHYGELVFGSLSNVKVVCMKGRFHYYEGYSLKKLTSPIRIMKLIGVNMLIVTNAAGSTNPKYKTGDIMVIKDHINFFGFGGQNPLRGPNDSTFGERFFPINKAFDRKLIKTARSIATEIGLENNFHEGVYAMVGGPNYESVAEIRALTILGVDAVGMSTVPEVLVAKHCGMNVFGFSLITNEGVADYDIEKEPNHEEVLKSVNKRSTQLREFITRIVACCEIREDRQSSSVRKDTCKAFRKT